MSRNRAASRGSSFRRRIVSGLCMYSEWGQTLGWNQFNLHLPPFAIPSCIGWTVAEHILVAQLYSNLCGYVGEFVGVVHAEHASSCDVRNLVQEIWAVTLFGCCRTVIEQSDGIDFDIGFLYQ